MLSRRNAENEEATTKSHLQLKQFLAQHKREMRSLRSNKFFQEFLNKANEGKRMLPAMRIVDEPDNSMVATLDLIRRTADKQNRPKEGVWSAFGQPYAPLGVPVVASKTLPPLARDEINGIVRDQPEVTGQRASVKIMDAGGPGRQAGRAGSPMRRSVHQAAAAEPAQQTQQPAAGVSGAKSPGGAGGSGSGKPATPVGGSLAQGEEALLCWAVSDEVEVRFPKNHLDSSMMREKKSKSTTSFVDMERAYRELCVFEDQKPEEEAEDEKLERIDEDLEDSQSLASDQKSHFSLKSDDFKTEAAEDEKPKSARSSKRASMNASRTSYYGPDGEIIEEGMEGEAGLSAEHSVLKNERPYSSRSAMIQRAKELAKNPQPVKPPTKPVIRSDEQKQLDLEPAWIRHVLFTKNPHMSRPVYRKRIGEKKKVDDANADNESEDGSTEAEVEFQSPVVRWRKEFLDVRLKMQEQLYNTLEERATRRAMAMQSTLYTTAVANQLMEDMRAHGGRMLTVPANAKMDSWTRAELAMHAQDQPKKVDVAEIQAIERFYEKLCHLVERQRVSDPLSLFIVHEVKKLLESGISMQRALLVKVLEQIFAIHQLGGADNPYIMPILHFIRQSVRVSAEDFEGMMHQMGLQSLIVKPAFASRGAGPKAQAQGPSGAGSFKSKEAEAAKAAAAAAAQDQTAPRPEELPDAGAKSTAQPKLDFE